jgi:hypothetical protein
VSPSNSDLPCRFSYWGSLMPSGFADRCHLPPSQVFGVGKVDCDGGWTMSNSVEFLFVRVRLSRRLRPLSRTAGYSCGPHL